MRLHAGPEAHTNQKANTMRTQKRGGVKTPGRQVTRVNLRLDAEQARRLFVFSVMENEAAGDIVSRLLADHLKGWSMPGKVTARATPTISATSDARVESITEIAA